MPTRPKKPCSYPRCPELVAKGAYCEKHKKQEHKRLDSYRGTPKERGYDTQWTKVRAMKLQQDPLCEFCESIGKVTPAVLVHHIKTIRDRPEIRLEMENLMSLCRSCHDEVHR